MGELGAMFGEVFKVIGLPPELFGLAVAVGILLRFARGMVSWFGPAHTYGAAVVFGVLAGIWRGWRVDVDGAPAAGLAVAAAVLLVQFGLQKLSGKVDWLPGDNQWAKDSPANDKGGQP